MLYVLFIGIDAYQHPEIGNLQGCKKDVSKFDELLNSHPLLKDQEKEVFTLVDEKATRKNIIEAFRNHFGKSNKKDTALFCFSGHGTTEPSPQEFINAGLEGHQLESLLPYDSRVDGIYNIADKELRVLLSEISNRGTQVVTILDCCHSGSITRLNKNEYSRSRQDYSVKYDQARPLEDFLDGFYSKQETLQIPPAEYLALCACEPQQKAIEDDRGGRFTSAIIEVLNAYTQKLPSYAELYAQVNYLLSLKQPIQNPQFEYFGDVNPYWHFLNKELIDVPAYFDLRKTGKQHFIDIGLVHGLSKDGFQDLNIPVYEQNKEDQKALTKARIKSINLETTELEIDPTIIEEKKHLTIPFISNPFPLKVTNPDEILKNKLIQHEFTSLLQIVPDTHYEIRCEEGKYFIIDNRRSENIICYTSQQGEEAVQKIYHSLKKIIKWERIKKIEHSRRNPINSNQVIIKCSFNTPHSKKEVFIAPYETKEAKQNKYLDYGINRVELDFTGQFFTYEFSVLNQSSSPLFFYLVHLSQNFSIQVKNEDFKKIESGNNTFYTIYNSLQFKKGLGIGKKNQLQELDHFLIFAVKRPLKFPFLFNQIEIQNDLDRQFRNIDIWSTSKKDSLESQSSDWIVKKLEVVINRKS